jgi:tRNA 2-selenouridine synthase
VSIPRLTYEEARLLRGARWVDLRSPSEHARDAIPGAVNVPLFDDDERALIGTLYKQVSPEAAYARGLALVTPRLDALFRTVVGDTESGSDGGKTTPVPDSVLGDETRVPGVGLVLYCWRGGMRSRSVAELLHSRGRRVSVLDGGYKTYRSWVMRRLAAWPPDGPSPFVLISGATGTGKTLLLQELEAAAPGTTLDLEACAGHRSSILGAVGRRPVSQPAFESRIVARAEQLGPPPWFVEAESRKVGDAIIPDALWRAMRAAPVVEFSAQTPTRVRVLVDDYLSAPGASDEIAERLPFLEGRLGAAWAGRLTALHAAGGFDAIAALLLEHYYDPLYRHSGRDLAFPCLEIAREDPRRVERLLELRQRLCAAPAPIAAALAARSVEFNPNPCADSSASPDCPATTSLRSSTRG